MDKVKTMDLVTLTKVANDVSNNVYTSLSMDEIVGILGEVAKYNIVDEGGFPEASMRGAGTLGSKGSCVYPINLTENVSWLHEFLFNDTGYELKQRSLGKCLRLLFQNNRGKMRIFKWILM